VADGVERLGAREERRAIDALADDRERALRELERFGVLADVHEQRRQQAQRLRLDERILRRLRQLQRAVELAPRRRVLADVEVEQPQATEGLGLELAPRRRRDRRRVLAHVVHLAQLRRALAPAAQDLLALAVHAVALLVRVGGQKVE